MQCAHCATPVPDDARFCHSCGSLVSDAGGQAKVTASFDDAAFRHMEHLLRAETAGEYEIDRMLGRGGMAVVYLARDIHLDRRIAVKVLPPELTFGHGVERFKREAKTAAALDHPNIIPIYRIGSGGKLFWYAMKYLEGRSLDEVLRERGRLPLSETIAVLQQVADALDYAHQQRVIHRDIKPANVMIDDRGRATVTDFGIAKALTEGTLTASGSVIGTPYFMSPEQGMGKHVSGASDQYSVAVLAYRMVSGRVPFEGDSAIDILHKHCMMPPPPLEPLQGGLPGHVYRAVHKALEKDPKRRFSSVGAFVDGLRSETEELAGYAIDLSGAETVALAGTPAPSSGPSQAAVTPDSGANRISTEFIRGAKGGAHRRGARRTAIGAGLVGAVAAVGVIWQLARSPGPSPEAPSTTQEEPLEVVAGGPDATQPEPAGQAPTVAETMPPPPAERPEPGRDDPAPPRVGGVFVSGLPANATIIAQGQRRTNPFELPEGRHEVEIRASGYDAFRTLVNVVPGARATVAYGGRRTRVAAPQPAAVDSGAVVIVVRPPAELFLNGVSLGVDNRRQVAVRAGVPNAFRFVADGYQTLDTTVAVAKGQTVPLAVRLVPRQ